MIAIPTLAADVPLTYTRGGAGEFLPQLAEGLVRAGVIDWPDGMPAHVAQGDVRTLLDAGLNRWWQPLVEGLTYWRAPLLVGENVYTVCDADDSWVSRAQLSPVMLLGTLPEDELRAPLELRPRIEALEREAAGFGQTALAVLEDALRLLPESISPASTFGRASWAWWSGETSDAAVLDMMRGVAEDEKITDAELRDMYDIQLPSDFERSIPRWAHSPQRVRSRLAIRRAAKSPYARRVLDALDAVHAAAWATPVGLPFDHLLVDGLPVSFGPVLFWQRDDITTHATDAFCNQLYEAGESIEATSAQALDITPKGLAEWRARVENTVRLAAATEALIELIGEPI